MSEQKAKSAGPEQKAAKAQKREVTPPLKIKELQLQSLASEAAQTRQPGFEQGRSDAQPAADADESLLPGIVQRLEQGGQPLGAREMSVLQRTAGMQAAGRLVQRARLKNQTNGRAVEGRAALTVQAAGEALQRMLANQAERAVPGVQQGKATVEPATTSDANPSRETAPARKAQPAAVQGRAAGTSLKIGDAPVAEEAEEAMAAGEDLMAVATADGEPAPTESAQSSSLQRMLARQPHYLWQAKLTVGPAGDAYEREADAVAQQVMGRLGESGAQNGDGAGVLRREADEEADTERAPAGAESVAPSISTLRRQGNGNGRQSAADAISIGLAGGEASSEIEGAIERSRGAGQPLADKPRGQMEGAFGANFGNVRIHTNPVADTLNRSLQARAFTTGSDIYFRRGEYSPGSKGGQELLAHELTHVVQQTGALSRLLQSRRIQALHIQRANALSTKKQPTYDADPQHPNRVRTGRLGKKKSGQTIPIHKPFDVAPAGAEGAPRYHKILTAPNTNQFAYDGNYATVAAADYERIVSKETHIKWGPDPHWVKVYPGDVVHITGASQDYLLGYGDHYPQGRGQISKTKVVARAGGLEVTGAPGTTYVAKKTTKIYKEKAARNSKTGVDLSQEVATLQPGDKLLVNFAAKGMDASGATNRWVYAKPVVGTDKGYVDPSAIMAASAQALAVGNPVTDAATTEAEVTFHHVRDADRGKSIGVGAESGTIDKSGDTLKVDLAASGVDMAGNENLVLAHSIRAAVAGYVAKDKVRDVAASRGKLEEKMGAPPAGQPLGPKQLEAVDRNMIVTGSTKLRQMQESGLNAAISGIKATYQMEPGDILDRTPESRVVPQMEGRTWASEMLFNGKTLGMVDLEKSHLLEAGEEVALHRTVDTLQNLKQVRVKESTKLRKILDKRNTTIRIGESFGKTIKADEIVDADFDLKGVDDKFSDDWVLARTSDGAEGYIDENKVTHEESEGLIKTVDIGGDQVTGNEIPAGNVYVGLEKHTRAGGLEVGDLLDATDKSVSTQKFYRALRSRRTAARVATAKSTVRLASDPLLKDPPTPVTAVHVLAKAHFRQLRFATRAQSVGLKTDKDGDAFAPGDKLMVDFASSGILPDGDTDWLFAQRPDFTTGYIRASKVRESSADLLAAANQGAIPDRYVPVYVTKDTHLRDEKNQKKGDEKKTGDLIMVNFASNPPDQIADPDFQGIGPPTPMPNPYFDAGELGIWVRTQGATPEEALYVRAYKVAAQSASFTRDVPGVEDSSTGGVVYDAFKLLVGGVQEASFESAGGWGVGTTGDIYEGASGSGLTGSEGGPLSSVLIDPDKGPAYGHEDVALATAGVAGGLMGLLGTVEGLRELFGSDKSITERLKGLLKTTQSGLSGVAAAARGAEYISKSTGNSSSEGLAKEVAGWAAGIAGAIVAVKELFLAISSLFSNKRKKERIGDLLIHVLEASAAGVKAARFFTKLSGTPGTNELAVTVPIIGLVIDLATIIGGAYKVAISGKQGRAAHEAQKEDSESALDYDNNKLVQAVRGHFAGEPIDRNEPHFKSDQEDQKKKLFWKEKRGIRSLSSGYQKTSYFRVNPKILFAIRNKDRLDKKLADGTLHERSRQFISTDYAMIVDGGGQPTGILTVIIDPSRPPVKISAAAIAAVNEYEFASKVEEVSKKKRTLGWEAIETGFVNLVGDALGISGITAAAGAMTKGVMAAINLGFDFARFINRQRANTKGKELSAALKYKGDIEGVDHSQAQKQREYYDHAFFIMDSIASLAGPTEILAASQDAGLLATYKEKYDTVQNYIKMTGVYTQLFYDRNGEPVKQVELIVESLAER